MNTAERALSDGTYTTADADHGAIEICGGVAAMTGELDYALATAWQTENPQLPKVHTIDAQHLIHLGSAGMVPRTRDRRPCCGSSTWWTVPRHVRPG